MQMGEHCKGLGFRFSSQRLSMSTAGDWDKIGVDVECSRGGIREQQRTARGIGVGSGMLHPASFFPHHLGYCVMRICSRVMTKMRSFSLGILPNPVSDLNGAAAAAAADEEGV